MMDTNIFGKLEPFEIGCVVKYLFKDKKEFKRFSLNPLKSGRVVKLKNICQ